MSFDRKYSGRNASTKRGFFNTTRPCHAPPVSSVGEGYSTFWNRFTNGPPGTFAARPSNTCTPARAAAAATRRRSSLGDLAI